MVSLCALSFSSDSMLCFCRSHVIGAAKTLPCLAWKLVISVNEKQSLLWGTCVGFESLWVTLLSEITWNASGVWHSMSSSSIQSIVLHCFVLALSTSSVHFLPIAAVCKVFWIWISLALTHFPLRERKRKEIYWATSARAAAAGCSTVNEKQNLLWGMWGFNSISLTCP